MICKLLLRMFQEGYLGILEVNQQFYLFFLTLTLSALSTDSIQLKGKIDKLDETPAKQIALYGYFVYQPNHQINGDRKLSKTSNEIGGQCSTEIFAFISSVYKYLRGGSISSLVNNNR